VSGFSFYKSFAAWSTSAIIYASNSYSEIPKLFEGDVWATACYFYRTEFFAIGD